MINCFALQPPHVGFGKFRDQMKFSVTRTAVPRSLCSFDCCSSAQRASDGIVGESDFTSYNEQEISVVFDLFLHMA